ncbi:MAG: hypothetical protein JJU28_08565 [Cyclobacteriaceae bacterium]|nr:hypothetical protein [Cyclobacteriaceae bacterium]
MDAEGLCFEIAMVSFVFALGNILLGHFEEKTPKWNRAGKFLATLVIVCLISVFFGRMAAMILLAISLIPVAVLHLWWLPKNGINGWTAEPRDRYYEFRGWDKKSDKKL